ncbi:hypothetical protein AB1N83_005717 [Pleurotus pulmonarius]
MSKIPNEILFAIVDQPCDRSTKIYLSICTHTLVVARSPPCAATSRRIRASNSLLLLRPTFYEHAPFGVTADRRNPGVLSLLPARAPLTHLILDRRLCSEDFSHLLSYYPTLESITLPGGNTNGHTIDLTSATLPNLRSLAAVFDTSLQVKNPMPSVLNLTISRHSDGPTVGLTVMHLPSICTLAFQDANLPILATLASYLPNLEYLQITLYGAHPIPEAPVLANFTTTKLKYLQFIGSDRPKTTVVDRLFDAVANLVIIDVKEDEGESLRWVRGFGVPIEVKNFDDDDVWRHWWESSGKDVEDICRRYKSEITKVSVQRA